MLDKMFVYSDSVKQKCIFLFAKSRINMGLGYAKNESKH